MCCQSKQARVAGYAQANQSRCPSCYKSAPYHRRRCALAAATIASAQPAVQARDSTSPPPYEASTTSGPTVVAYEGRRNPHGPIGFAVRWGVEKIQQKRDEKKFMEEFEQRRSMDRQSSSSSESERSGSDQFEAIDGSWDRKEKRGDLI